MDNGAVRGHVVLATEGARLADIAPVIVYLDPIDAPVPPTIAESAQVHQRNDQFSPRFLSVAAGTTVEIPNDDSIYHNAFSYSHPNDFDLGLYSGGETRSVTLRHAGVGNLYCSIHESMNGSIFVAPSPHFATLRRSGSFHLADVPPGRYRLRTWSEKLPPTSQVVEIVLERTVEQTIVIGGIPAAD